MFRVEAESLRAEFNANLSLDIKSLRLLCVYDLFGFSDELLERCRYRVFGEVVTDRVTDEMPEAEGAVLAVEYLPGQFDQRAASAVDCVHLIEPAAEIAIKSSRLLMFDSGVSAEDMERIRHYYINAVESREKDLSRLDNSESAEKKPVPVLEGFTAMESEEELAAFCSEWGLAMNTDDLRTVVEYFRNEGRQPNQTELRILDTYWSDHCRHTTFTTHITDIEIEPSAMSESLAEAVALWKELRAKLGRTEKPFCLMDLATIGARYLSSIGALDDQEQSEENNACSIFIDVDVDGEIERYLLQFKNETHNHPTEIEPFGGASTCLGGAIRDPLSGRSYVYQAMRVTGAGNIYATVAETLEGKLPQRVISLKAAAGYSSYGNQMGLATTCVREIFHPGYTAKRMEVGAVVGAVKADSVRRESPAAGDVVLMLGGRTGRDGIGGATGSSKEHNTKSLEECGSEVQKGNAPEERKLQRLFRRAEVTRLIKKSNDFGAGGVSVAIGELADGLDIFLDRVPTKYSGLNSTELAISESQERMSVVIEPKDEAEFRRYCAEENIEVTHVANVTDTARMRMFYGEDKVVDLSREFIDSAGAIHRAAITIAAEDVVGMPAREVDGEDAKERFLVNLTDDNVVCQKGLVEMFDSTVGRSTVLMPYGGATQQTEAQVSMQKIPVGDAVTNTASVMTFGYNPDVAESSPYHSAAYAVVEAVAKAVAAGAPWRGMRFSYQEYFEKMSSRKAWGKPLSALLGALRMQVELNLPSIGGKDSMSGTFGDMSVPPTLIAFGVTTIDARKALSPEFKGAGHPVYLVRHTPKADGMPDTEQLARLWDAVGSEVVRGSLLAGWAVTFGGVAEGLAKMTFGNRVGVEVNMPEAELYDYAYGSILVETDGRELNFEGAELIGKTISEPVIKINGTEISIAEAVEANCERFTSVYPSEAVPYMKEVDCCEAPFRSEYRPYSGEAKESPVVYLPVFPGTNCDYDTAKAFVQAGAQTTTSVLCNLTADDVNNSIALMCQKIDEADIVVFSGGFSAGDEPDGSGKFIAAVLCNADVKAAMERLLQRDGLVLGICNGFQALIKSGLLPFGKIGELTTESPTLFRNDINRHISQIVTTRVASAASPWLAGFTEGELHSIAVSHGEGKFVVGKELAEQLFRDGQVAFRYADAEGQPTMASPMNPNGSYYAIEGICSPDGRILGKMGHTERWEDNLFKNISGNKSQRLFENAVNYFRKK